MLQIEPKPDCQTLNNLTTFTKNVKRLFASRKNILMEVYHGRQYFLFHFLWKNTALIQNMIKKNTFKF